MPIISYPSGRPRFGSVALKKLPASTRQDTTRSQPFPVGAIEHQSRSGLSRLDTPHLLDARQPASIALDFIIQLYTFVYINH
ncbi:hypothetical protein AWB69_05276 [Caballeronia udeis]|uniref:Uncharacterized protein n=1 Tax=Caballeronia udeis TaxID=1232866 RepID=A0A158I4E4_9BURK|nr:hypothetical protein AWB69_05276 [Caballeronia udeis]